MKTVIKTVIKTVVNTVVESTLAVEQPADEVAKKFAENWETWNVTDHGTHLKYKRPYLLTKKQVDWLRNVWIKQYKWGSARDRAYESRTIDNLGGSCEGKFLWQVSVHLHGSATFEVLVFPYLNR